MSSGKKSGDKKSAGKKSAGRKAGGTTVPKLKCCESRNRCRRCPLRMLKDGTLPEGHSVKHRRVVRLDGGKVTKKKLQKAAARG